MRPDIKLIKEFEATYMVDIQGPFLSKVVDLIRSTGFKDYVIPKTFKKKLNSFVREWLERYEKTLDGFFAATNEEVYQAWFEELRKKLPKHFRYKRTEYLIDEQKKRILKKVANRWLVQSSLVKRATFEIWKYYEKDGLKLSDRIWKMAKQTAQDIQKQVMLSLQTGMSARRLRDQILKTAEQQPIEIPKWLKRQLKEAEPDAIAKKVEKYIKKKQKYNAMRVARTEIQRAWRVNYVEQTKELPFVKGIKWNLSGSHQEKDICDELATANPTGMGPGIYPPDSVPYNGGPAHPQCLCYLTSVLAPLELPDETTEPAQQVQKTTPRKSGKTTKATEPKDIFDEAMEKIAKVPLKSKYTPKELQVIYTMIDPGNPRGLPKKIRNVKLTRMAGYYKWTKNFSVDDIVLSNRTDDKLLTFIHESLHRQYTTRSADAGTWGVLEEGVVDFLSKYMYKKAHPNIKPWKHGYTVEPLKLIIDFKRSGKLDDFARMLYKKRMQGIHYAEDKALKFLSKSLQLNDDDIAYLFEFTQKRRDEVRKLLKGAYEEIAAPLGEINAKRFVEDYMKKADKYINDKDLFKEGVKRNSSDVYTLLQILQYLLLD